MPASVSLQRKARGTVIQVVETVAIMAAAVAAWIFVPHDVLLPACVATLFLAVGGVFAIKAYVGRLPVETHFEQRGLLLELAFVLALAGFVAFLVLVLEFS